MNLSKVSESLQLQKILGLLWHTILSQIVAIFGTFLLAKYFYSPEEMGALSFFLAVISIGSTLAMLRLDLTIVLHQDMKSAIQTLQFCLALAACAAPVLWLFFYLIQYINSDFCDKINFLSLFGIFFLAGTSAFQLFMTKADQFKIISYARILQSVSILGGQILFFYIDKNSGLIIGNLLGLLVCYYYFRIKSIPLGYANWSFFDLKKNRQIVKKYSKIAFYSLPSGVANLLYQNIQPVLILAWFGKAEAGLFFFAVRILQAPLQLISSSVSNIFYKEASELMANQPQKLFGYTLKMQALIGGVIILPVLFLAVTSQQIILFFFDAKWAASGQYLSILVCLFFFRSLYNPISYIAEVVNKVQVELVFNVFLLGSNVAALYVAHQRNDFLLAVQLITFFGCIGYLGLCLYFTVINYKIKNKKL